MICCRRLHEEIARLPEKYRLAVVHCDLEGMTQAQAAGQLHWSERTIHRRLAEGRARLKRRLARRGLAPDGATLGAVFLREARAAVPAAWSEATVRAAVATVNPTMTVGVVSAAAQQLTQEVFKIMLLQKLTLASATLLAAGLIAWGASAALVSLGQEAAEGGDRAAGTDGQANSRYAGPQPKPGPDRHRRHVPGPRPGARPRRQAGRRRRDLRAPPRRDSVEPDRPDGRAAEGACGGDRCGRPVPFRAGQGVRATSRLTARPGWHQAQIAAAAPGFAPAWVEAGDLVKGGEATLRLVRDDVPVRGRVLDSQGRPVAGVVVRIQLIWEVKDGVDLDAMLASGEVDENQMAREYGLYQRAPTWQADPAPSGRAAGTPGPPAPTVGSRSGGSGATASPGSSSTAAEWRTARST